MREVPTRPNDMLPGDMLPLEDQQKVLRWYPHRYTGQHKPSWANTPRPNGELYPVQFKDDADWLRNTLFHVNKVGGLDERKHYCESHPTWPNNPELRDVYPALKREDYK